MRAARPTGYAGGVDVFALVFRAAASLRSARALHPRGRTMAGTLDVRGEGPLPTGSRPVLARVSKGAGLPGSMPDALGIAFRVEDDAGSPVDVLCTTALGDRGWRAYAVAPSRSWRNARLTSLMTWRQGERRAQVRLRVRGAGTDSVDLRHAPELLPIEVAVVVVEHGEPVQTGTLTLTELSGRRGITFDPMRNHPQGWALGPGWLARVREAAYVGSRRGRGASAEH